MEVIAKRGDNQFLVEIEEKKFTLVTLGRKEFRVEDNADIFYRAGYFIDEEPTSEELEEIKRILG